VFSEGFDVESEYGVYERAMLVAEDAELVERIAELYHAGADLSALVAEGVAEFSRTDATSYFDGAIERLGAVM
jgi:hypothetical protein